METESFLESGNLEQYCFEPENAELEKEIGALRLTHPEIIAELNEIELTIEKIAESQAITPRPQLKNRILAAIKFNEEKIDLNNLPPTSSYSNYQNWLKAVEHLLPTAPFGDFFALPLQQNEQIAQTLVITRLNVPEEVHEVIAESFFILEGTCTCTVGKDIFTLNAGDHLNIPLHTSHDIRIDSPYVIAILQHQYA